MLFFLKIYLKFYWNLYYGTPKYLHLSGGDRVSSPSRGCKSWCESLCLPALGPPCSSLGLVLVSYSTWITWNPCAIFILSEFYFVKFTLTLYLTTRNCEHLAVLQGENGENIMCHSIRILIITITRGFVSACEVLVFEGFKVAECYRFCCCAYMLMTWLEVSLL